MTFFPRIRSRMPRVRPVGVLVPAWIAGFWLMEWLARPGYMSRLWQAPLHLWGHWLPSTLLGAAFFGALAVGGARRPWRRLVVAAVAAGMVVAVQRVSWFSYGRLFDEYDIRYLWAHPGYAFGQGGLMAASGAAGVAVLAAAILLGLMAATRHWLPAFRGRTLVLLAVPTLLWASTQIQWPRQLHPVLSQTWVAASAAFAPQRFLRMSVQIAREPWCEPHPEPPLPARSNILWVLGESLNRSRMSLYGYARDTTPWQRQQAEAGELWVMRDAYTIGTWTRVVQPYLLAGHESWDPERRLERLTTLFHDAKCAGYATVLVSSQTLEYNGVADLIAREGVDRFVDGRTIYPEATIDSGADDTRSLDVLLGELARMPEPWLALWIQNGQHHPYRLHYPPEFERWTPVSDSPAQPEAFVNAYENAVLYGDAVLQRLFEGLEGEGWLDRTLVAFHPDHGERMGEQAWFHGSVEIQELVVGGWFRLPPELRQAPAAATLAANLAGRIYVDDMRPTLAAAMGVTAPPGVTGRNLWAPVVARPLWISHWTLNNPPHAHPVISVIDGDRLWRYRLLEQGWFLRELWGFETTDVTPAQVPPAIREKLERDLAAKMPTPAP